ncbi:MAG: chaperonin cofactor prefoldin [Halobacteriales archaeon]|jgi:chaperonin cofactor prefoldin
MATTITFVEGGIDVDRLEAVETVTLETEEVRLEKGVFRTDTGRGVVDIRIKTKAEAVFGTRFVDPLPSELDVESAKENHGDTVRWTVTEGDNISFEAVVEPGNTTGIGYVATDIENLEGLCEQPKIDELQEMGVPESEAATETDDSEGTPENDSTASEDAESISNKVRKALSFSSGDSGFPQEGVDANDQGDKHPDRETTSSDGKNDEERMMASPNGGRADDPAETDGGAQVDGEAHGGDGNSSKESLMTQKEQSVAPEEVPGIFVNQLQAGALSSEEIEALREALGIEVARSRATRLEHLETRFTKFEAYIEALEAFIDENGAAEEIIDEFHESVEELSERVGTVESEIEEIREEHAGLRAVVEDRDERISAIEDRVEGLETKFEELESTAADNESKIETLEAGQATIRSDLDDGIRDLRSDQADRRAELKTDLQDDQEALRTDLETSVEAMDSDLEDLSSRMEDLESSWRKIRDAFGGD